MPNYSYYCKHCGFTFMSNHKAEIRMVKAGHRVKSWHGLQLVRRCAGMVEVSPGRFRRSALVEA
jgi:hypothetical protein